MSPHRNKLPDSVSGQGAGTVAGIFGHEFVECFPPREQAVGREKSVRTVIECEFPFQNLLNRFRTKPERRGIADFGAGVVLQFPQTPDRDLFLKINKDLAMVLKPRFADEADGFGMILFPFGKVEFTPVRIA